jgi:hypothetical protein
MVESPLRPLYLLGNIQAGKSKKKLQPARMIPMLAENSLSQPYTYVRNIQTGKSKKLFLSIGILPGCWGNIDHAPYLFKEP